MAGVGADTTGCLTGTVELGVDVAEPSLPVCPLVATVVFRSLLWLTSLYVALCWTRGFSLRSVTPRTSARAVPRL